MNSEGYGEGEGTMVDLSFIGGGEQDFCTREGAQRLKSKIEAYWRERGHNITVQLQNVGFHPAIRAARYDVRSDMVNGMPRRSGGRSAPAARGAGNAALERQTH